MRWTFGLVTLFENIFEKNIDVYKATTKVEDFDEAMAVFQVRVNFFEVRDVY
jgi:hypothetical protein